jgi:hypothetical protein
MIINGIKTGQYVSFCGKKHIFLGYIDSKGLRCLIADKHGNKLKLFIEQIGL